MLDRLGLDKQDSEGYRLRTDGKDRLRIELMTFGGQAIQFTQIGEMIRQQWKMIGIDLNVREVERGFGTSRILANENQLFIWPNGETVPELLAGDGVLPNRLEGVPALGYPICQWFVTGGKQGKEPKNPRMREGLEKYRQAFSVPEAERIRLCKEIWAIAIDEVFTIGTVGQSPAFQGVRIAKTGLGNMPARIVNNSSLRHPALARPATFFWKKR
jgi:peptide/nickel transport system substrate-binding protein